MSKWIYTCKDCKAEHKLGCNSCNRKSLKGKKVVRTTGNTEYFLECTSCGHLNSKWRGVFYSRCCSDILINSITKKQFSIKDSDRYFQNTNKIKIKSYKNGGSAPQQWFLTCRGCNKQVQIICKCTGELFASEHTSGYEYRYLKCSNCGNEKEGMSHTCQHADTGEAIWNNWQDIVTHHHFVHHRDSFYPSTDLPKGGDSKIILIGLIVLGCLIGLSSFWAA